MAFELHEVEWTAEKIARFWNALNSCDWALNSHFSQLVGRALKEIHRMLRVGGMLVVTTPNDESLEQAKTICPECGAIFHRMQHVARYDRMSLTALMEQSGFKTLHCDSAQLEHYEPRLGLKGWVRRWRDRRRRYLPHLIYIGTKTA